MAVNTKKKSGREGDSFRDEFIRRFRTSPFLFLGTILILVIVIVAFVLVPALVPNARGGDIDRTFGYYNRVPINFAPGSFFAQYKNDLDDQETQNRQNPAYQPVSEVELLRRAFDETVVRFGILDEMKASGYTAPEETVDRRIAENPVLLARYRQADSGTKISLWRQVQEDIAEDYYRLDVNGFRVPAAEAAFIGAMASRERSFDMVSLPLSSYPDGELVSYAEANPALFRVLRLSRITLGSGEKEAQQILGTIRGEITTFEDAARTHSQDAYADQGGDMGQKMAYELVYEIPDEAEREKIIGLGKGEISQAIPVPGGWAFFRVEEAAAPANMGNTALLDKVRSYITTFERGRMEDWLIKDAEALGALIREEGLSEALYRRGLKERSFGPLPINYGDNPLFTSLLSFRDSQGQIMIELYYAMENEEFWSTAFFSPLNTPSAPLVLGDSVVLLFPKEETENTGKAADLESSYSSYMAGGIANLSIRSYFTTHKKLEDRFDITYNQFSRPAY
jgi:hypothetical protein